MRSADLQSPSIAGVRDVRRNAGSRQTDGQLSAFRPVGKIEEAGLGLKWMK
jgi:hypothetical protein